MITPHQIHFSQAVVSLSHRMAVVSNPDGRLGSRREHWAVVPCPRRPAQQGSSWRRQGSLGTMDVSEDLTGRTPAAEDSRHMWPARWPTALGCVV